MFPQSLPQVFVAGRLTADPELRFTPSGKAVANFTIASGDKRKNKNSGEWEDGDKCFLRCNVWAQAAENVAESLHKGDAVTASGRLVQRDFETREGEKRSVMELRVDSIAAEIDRNTVTIHRAERGSSAAPQGAASQDPWGSSSSSSTDDAPPF